MIRCEKSIQDPIHCTTSSCFPCYPELFTKHLFIDNLLSREKGPPLNLYNIQAQLFNRYKCANHEVVQKARLLSEMKCSLCQFASLQQQEKRPSWCSKSWRTSS